MSSLLGGEAVIKLLENYGVDTVFGIPGVHTIELYRGFRSSEIHHVTPRHEQGAGFMADGYARAGGKPGVCFIITGPGMTNIATAMGQALMDSVPMLVISSVNSRTHLAMGEGRLHELANQQALMSEVSVFSHTLLDINNLPKVLARAFAVFDGQRPGPVHIEIPIDVLKSDASHLDLIPWPRIKPPGPHHDCLEELASLIKTATRPLLVIGGGACRAGEAITELAERIDSPVINTNNAKGVVAPSHPLAVGASPSCPWIRQELAEKADLVIALGTELSETDYDFFGYGDLEIKGKLVRVDIDAQQLMRNVKPEVAIQADVGECVRDLLDLLDRILPDGSSSKTEVSNGAERAAQLNQVTANVLPAGYREIFDVIEQALPSAIMVGDSNQLSYYAQAFLQTQQPNHYFHSATGFGTLGYAFPAAQGAKLARPEVPVICLTGDGGGQFTSNEISTAVGAEIPVIFLVWNNSGHGEIRRFMDAADVPQVGVNIHTPDYVALAQACGCSAQRVASLEAFKAALLMAKEHQSPYLIDVVADQFVTDFPFTAAVFETYPA